VRRFDVLVLGGGAAGCVLASRLSENADRTVALVEAGPDYGPFEDGRWPADILDARRLALDSHCWERDDEDDRSQLRAKILGGCSAHNACVLMRGDPRDYEWGGGWSYQELVPFLERAERKLEARRPTDDELAPWLRALRNAAGDADALQLMNAAGTVRWNVAFAYVDPARARPNLSVLAETLVDRLLLEDGVAGGAVAGGQELAADVVVVAAGSYGSAGILLRSGIGPAEELGRHKIPLVVELPVGEGLTDHVGTGAAWRPTGQLQADSAEFAREHELLTTAVVIHRRTSACTPELWDLLVLPAFDEGDEISAAVFFMNPRSRGSVRLNGAEPEAPLAIDHGFLRNESDAEALTEGFDQLRELARSEIPARYASEELRPGAAVTAAMHVRTTARGFFHPVGTCAIGSVVDGRCRVRGLENVYVVDASVMPTIPRVPVHLSTLALTERAAEWI
jgi:choline dehydrogenase